MKNLLLTLTCLILAAHTHASERYRVEVMIFAYLDENSAREEHWPLLEQWKQEEVDTMNALLLQASDMDEELVVDLEVSEELPEADVISPMTQPLSDLEFSDAAARFRYRDDISLLWHQAWVEDIQNIDNPIVHEIKAEFERDITIKLSGSIQLHRSRFIHITPDLVVEQFIFTVPEPIAESTIIDDDSNSNQMNVELNDSMLQNSTLVMPELEVETNKLEINQTPTPEWIPLRAAKVNLSRRMRSGEVHYIDHPLLGMVVKVTPL